MYLCMYKKLKRKQNIVDACEKRKKKDRRKNMTAMQKKSRKLNTKRIELKCTENQGCT